MSSGEISVERRTFQRFKMMQGVFAIIGPTYRDVGRILDISRDGLSFQYDGEKEWPRMETELDIFGVIGNDKVYLPKLPFMSVEEKETVVSLTPAPKKIRRCSIQFGDLSPSQISSIEALIHSCKNDDEWNWQ